MSYTVDQFRADLEQPYAWPGGYPRYFITSDGACLSYKAAREMQNAIEESLSNDQKDGWKVEGCDINWESTDLYCDHTGEQIESAYGND